jgi:hypothetical protein
MINSEKACFFIIALREPISRKQVFSWMKLNLLELWEMPDREIDSAHLESWYQWGCKQRYRAEHEEAG